MADTKKELLKISGLKTVIKVRNGEIVPVDQVDITSASLAAERV